MQNLFRRKYLKIYIGQKYIWKYTCNERVENEKKWTKDYNVHFMCPVVEIIIRYSKRSAMISNRDTTLDPLKSNEFFKEKKKNTNNNDLSYLYPLSNYSQGCLLLLKLNFQHLI